MTQHTPTKEDSQRYWLSALHDHIEQAQIALAQKDLGLYTSHNMQIVYAQKVLAELETN